jgi:hypothetical protein
VKRSAPLSRGVGPKRTTSKESELFGGYVGMSDRRPSDDVIEAGLAASGVIPELVSWMNCGLDGVCVRIEVHIGRYVEFVVRPWHDVEDIAYEFERASERLQERLS